MLCGDLLRPTVAFSGRMTTYWSSGDVCSPAPVLLPPGAAKVEAGLLCHGVCGRLQLVLEVVLQRQRRPKWSRPWRRRGWSMADGAEMAKDRIAFLFYLSGSFV